MNTLDKTVERFLDSAEFAGVVALPCPFCGCKDLRFRTRFARMTQYYFVSCANIDCEAGGPSDLGRSGALEKWNEAVRARIKYNAVKCRAIGCGRRTKSESGYCWQHSDFPEKMK